MQVAVNIILLTYHAEHAQRTIPSTKQHSIDLCYPRTQMLLPNSDAPLLYAQQKEANMNT